MIKKLTFLTAAIPIIIGLIIAISLYLTVGWRGFWIVFPGDRFGDFSRYLSPNQIITGKSRVGKKDFFDLNFTNLTTLCSDY